jgi:UDP-glucose:(glucosyl)LPS beta-1,3-glucosyltransferase
MLLSIIIPCWNGEKFIGNILSLLIEQGLENIEVLVVNDGSTDDTLKIATEYVQKNSNIRVFSLEKNSGVSVARNKGIEKSQGKYLLFLDADDALPNETLDYYREVLSNKQYDTFVFGYENNLNGNIKAVKTLKSNGIEYDAVSFLKAYFRCYIYCHICSIIFRKEFLFEYSLQYTEGVKQGEDVEFYEKAFAFSSKIYYTNKITFTRIWRSNSASQAGKISKAIIFDDNFLRNLKNVDMIADKYPEIHKEANYRIVCRYLWFISDYLREKKNVPEATQKLLQYKKLLYRPIAFVFPRTIFIWLLRFLPLKLLFNILGKK